MKTVFGNQYFALEAIDEVPDNIREIYETALKILKVPFLHNLVKVEKDFQSVTLSYYPHLDENPHPYLKESLKIFINEGRFSTKKETLENPVILHRLETMLHSKNPRISELEEITVNEEELGFYGESHKLYLARRTYWNNLCREYNLLISMSPEDNLTNSTKATQLDLFGNTVQLVQRQKTAMSIKTASAPTREAFSLGYLKEVIFDWGCGKERDTNFLKENGLNVISYDKFLKPFPNPNDVDFTEINSIICNYVINVIENPTERLELIEDIFSKAINGSTVLISARSKSEIEEFAKKSKWRKYEDGYLTSTKTFQKGFALEELKTIIFKYGQILKAIETKSYVYIIIKVEKNEPII
jgi:hypothetical protein